MDSGCLVLDAKFVQHWTNFTSPRKSAITPTPTLRALRFGRVSTATDASAIFQKKQHFIEGRNTGFPNAVKALRANGSPFPQIRMDPERSYVDVIIPVHPAFLPKPKKTLLERTLPRRHSGRPQKRGHDAHRTRGSPGLQRHQRETANHRAGFGGRRLHSKKRHRRQPPAAVVGAALKPNFENSLRPIDSSLKMIDFIETISNEIGISTSQPIL